jgi:hypothetical protein
VNYAREDLITAMDAWKNDPNSQQPMSPGLLKIRHPASYARREGFFAALEFLETLPLVSKHPEFRYAVLSMPDGEPIIYDYSGPVEYCRMPQEK